MVLYISDLLNRLTEVTLTTQSQRDSVRDKHVRQPTVCKIFYIHTSKAQHVLKNFKWHTAVHEKGKKVGTEQEKLQNKLWSTPWKNVIPLQANFKHARLDSQRKINSEIIRSHMKFLLNLQCSSFFSLQICTFTKSCLCALQVVPSSSLAWSCSDMQATMYQSKDLIFFFIYVLLSTQCLC